MIHVSALFKPSSGTGFKMYEYTRGKQYSCEVTFFLMCTETSILNLSVFHFLNCFIVLPAKLKIKHIKINVLKSLLFV